MNLVLSNHENPLLGVLAASPEAISTTNFSNDPANFPGLALSPLDICTLNETSLEGSGPETAWRSVAPLAKYELGEQTSNGSNGVFKQEALGEFTNKIFLNSVRVGIRGALGLRSPVDFNTAPSPACPRPCGLAFITKIVAYDLENVVGNDEDLTNFSNLWAYYAFWSMDYPIMEYDVFEPINEIISPQYMFKGQARSANRYKLGFMLTGDNGSTGGRIGDITAAYDGFGIPDNFLGRMVSLRVSLDCDYTIPGVETEG